MPRRISLGADKVNGETGEPTFQKIYEPPRAPQGCGDVADVAPSVPTPRLAGAARTLTVKTGVLRLRIYFASDRVSADFDVVSEDIPRFSPAERAGAMSSPPLPPLIL